MHINFIRKYISIIRESAWVFSGQAVTLIGSLVLVKLLTSYLTPNQYGELALSLTTVGLISQLAMNSFGASIGRFYPVALEKDDLCHYIKASYKILLYAAGASIVIGFILQITLTMLNYTDWAWLIFLGFVFATLSLITFSANNVQNAARNRRIVAVNSSLETWLKILFAFLVIQFLGADALSVLIGYCIAIVSVIAFQAVFLKRLFVANTTLSNDLKHLKSDVNMKLATKNAERVWLHHIWQYAWPFAAWGVFTWAQQVSDLWSLKIFTTMHEVGLYSVAFQLGFAPIVLINTVIQLFLGPILNQWVGLDKELNKTRAVHNVTWLTTGLSLLFTFIAFVFFATCHEWLFGWLVASEFRSASVYLAWMALAGGLFSAGQILSLKLMSNFKSKKMLYVKIITALLGLFLNITGAWLFGINGIIGSIIIFSLFYFIWMAWLTWQKQH